jgi:phasin family protein
MAKATPTEQTNPFGDLTKMFEQFKVPGVDMGAIVESRRKDMDALVAANQATLESMQAMAKKQAEILAQAVQGVQDAAKGLANAGAGAPDAAKYAEIARKAYDKAVSDMMELAEMARKAQADAMAGITRRAMESMEEMKKLMKPR